MATFWENSTERKMKHCDNYDGDGLESVINLKDPRNVKKSTAKPSEPIVSISEYEKMPNTILDNVLQTNLCCLKALLHYTGFQVLSESPDLEIQCRLCDVKLLIKADEKYDLEMPKDHKKRCANTNCNSESLKTIILKHLHSLNNLTNEEKQTSFDSSDINTHQSDTLTKIDVTYETTEDTDIFLHKEILDVIIKLIGVRNQLISELKDRDSKIKEKNLEIEEKNLELEEKSSELKEKFNEIVKLENDFTDFEKVAIPRWDKHIKQREELLDTVKQLKATIVKKDQEIQNLTENNYRLAQLYNECKNSAYSLQANLMDEQKKNQYLEGKNESLEAHLKNNLPGYQAREMKIVPDQFFEELKAVEEQQHQMSNSVQDTQEVNTNQNAHQAKLCQDQKPKRKKKAKAQRPSSSQSTEQTKP